MALFKQSVYIGYDPREAVAFAVARHSARRSMFAPVPIYGLDLHRLRCQGLYVRPTDVNRLGRMWDVISGAPMSTEFAISRFLVPHLAQSGWALFMDADVLVLGKLEQLFEQADPTKAVMCVQHPNLPDQGRKMDGVTQVPYPRKNWSSVMLFNCDHPANKRLTVEAVNIWPGRHLHAFSWLQDEEIGALDPAWNWLVGHSDPAIKPKIVHFTDGGPWFPGFEDVPFADEWRARRDSWLAAP